MTEKSKEELLKILHERMQKEQQEYRKWLLAQRKNEILKLTPQFYVREQAVKEIGESDPFGKIGERYLYRSHTLVWWRYYTGES